MGILRSSARYWIVFAADLNKRSHHPSHSRSIAPSAITLDSRSTLALALDSQPNTLKNWDCALSLSISTNADRPFVSLLRPLLHSIVIVTTMTTNMAHPMHPTIPALLSSSSHIFSRCKMRAREQDPTLERTRTLSFYSFAIVKVIGFTLCQRLTLCLAPPTITFFNGHRHGPGSVVKSERGWWNI